MQANRVIPLPIVDPAWAGEQPFVEVSGKNQPVRDCVENSIQLSAVAGQSFVIPHVALILGIEPRFDMREMAAVYVEPRA